MKKFKIIILAAMVVILSAAPSARATDADKMESRRQEMYKDLNLSDAQKQELEASRNKTREEMKAIFAASKESRAALSRELQKEKLDMGRISQINGELKKLNAQMFDYRLRSILEVRKILTPEQFKTFTKKTEERIRHKDKDR